MVKQTMVHLTVEQIAQADAEAERRGISRSAVVRAALDTYFEAGRTATLDRQMLDGYERVPQATPDEWGDLGALADRTTRQALMRLAAEEERAGNAPW
ncbi:MAG: ribbon-helix-helix protein, CopG family [Actinomycetota bacterium]